MKRDVAARGATDERETVERAADERGTDDGRVGRGVDRAAFERATEVLAGAEPDAAERRKDAGTLPEADLCEAESA